MPDKVAKTVRVLEIIRLTITDEHMPDKRREHMPDNGSLQKRRLRLFFKRLRKSKEPLPKSSIKRSRTKCGLIIALYGLE